MLKKSNTNQTYGAPETSGFDREQEFNVCWDLVAHPVTQVIGEQALVDILDLSEAAWTC